MIYTDVFVKTREKKIRIFPHICTILTQKTLNSGKTNKFPSQTRSFLFDGRVDDSDPVGDVEPVHGGGGGWGDGGGVGLRLVVMFGGGKKYLSIPGAWRW